MSNFFKSLFTPAALQPLLTVVLIVGFILLGNQYLSSRGRENDVETVRIIDREVSFEEAVDKILNGSFEVYTSGALYVATNQKQSLENPALQSSPTPSATVVTMVENKYDDLFFILDKNSVRRIDTKTFDTDASILINRKGEIVYINNTLKKYTIYKVPADDETNAVKLFEGVNVLFQDQIFPLTPLIKSYKDRKFNPIKRAYNVYSGKWVHPVYTNGKVEEIVVETDSSTGIFKSMSITGTNPPSIIYFDFRKLPNIENYDQIPSGFEEVPVPRPYKTKS